MARVEVQLNEKGHRKASDLVDKTPSLVDDDTIQGSLNSRFDSLVKRAGIDPAEKYKMRHGSAMTVDSDVVDVSAEAARLHEAGEGGDLDTLMSHISSTGRAISPKLAQAMTRIGSTRATESAALASVPLEAFAEMIAEGIMLPKIAKELGMSNWVVSRYAFMRDRTGLLAEANAYGAQHMLSKAWDMLVNADPDSKGSGMIAKNAGDFAQWYAAKADPDKWAARAEAEPTLTQGGESMGATVVINVDNENDTQACVVTGRTIDEQGDAVEGSHLDILPFDVNINE